MPTDRHRTLGVGAALSLLFLTPWPVPASPASSETTAHHIAQAATALRESLPADQRSESSYAFDDEERFDLRLAPFFLEGLEMSDMSARSKDRLGDLLEASLGDVGRRKADAVRGLEAEVVRQEPWYQSVFTSLGGIRGDEAYFLSFYGDPDPAGRFGYRFDGHHLSVNMTAVDGDVSPTPLFLGAQPRVIPEGGVGGPVGFRVLADEEDRARALYESLDGPQRARATLELELGRGLFVGEGERVDPDLPPVGIAAGDLNDEQARLLNDLVDAYFQNVAPSLAARERARAEEAGWDEIHFAWAGSTAPGAPIYYRVHGPTLLIEYDDTVDGGEHVHTLWRDPSGDFGRDLLRHHHETAHRSDASE